ncbi:MAG TPA: non-heme iron oxygenase ferredoxin subunit [Gammaproteobacteria bacterium]|nr:non-heme iron oxygenase ferredoxin subunit [Gammaproteobacteria bacterium]
MNGQWHDVVAEDQMALGARAFYDLDDGTHVAVFKLADGYAAIESMCTHALFELDDAPIEGDKITCPLHGAKFCLRTGAVCSPPAYEDLRTFPVRIHNGMIQIQET